MTLLDVHVDLNRVATALERIVFLLDRLVYPPPPAEIKVQQATLDDLHIVTEEVRERMKEEMAAFAERYGVAPGSEAFTQALEFWEAEQRSLYGETWQTPGDWKTVFAEAARSRGPGGDPAGSAAGPAARG